MKAISEDLLLVQSRILQELHYNTEGFSFDFYSGASAVTICPAHMCCSYFSLDLSDVCLYVFHILFIIKTGKYLPEIKEY